VFQLTVTYEFDLDADQRPADARLDALLAYLRPREGFIDTEVHQLDRNRFSLISRWESSAAADAALGGEGAAGQLAMRAGIVIERPDAIGVTLP
jgi:quinol monooxygenase YgiN